MNKLVVSFVLALIIGFSGEAFGNNVSQQWVQGKNYYRITSSSSLTVTKNVVVTEVFSFGCPGCNAFQPYIDKLKEKLPRSVVFEFVPASWFTSEDWVVFQRAFFTAKTLGLETTESHDAVFKAIWGQGGSLAITDSTTKKHLPESKLPTILDIAEFYAVYGTKPGKFVATANSPLIDKKMRLADKEIKAWEVRETPTIVVDNKWRADLESAGGPRRLVQLTLYLVNMDLATRKH